MSRGELHPLPQIIAAMALALLLMIGGLQAEEQVFITVKLTDEGCAEAITFFSQSRMIPLSASKIGGEYVLGPLKIGEVVEVSIKPSEECYVERLLEDARLRSIYVSIDPSTGTGSAIIQPTYNGSYTIILRRYEKVYLTILADPPKCLAEVVSNKPVKKLGEGYYRVGPWYVGGLIRDAGELAIEAAKGCRFQQWRGPYEFTSLYEGLMKISGLAPEKNMTIISVFENMTEPAAPSPLPEEERGETKPTPQAIIAFLQTPAGKVVAATPLIIAALCASARAVRWMGRKRRAKRELREEALKTLCLMERAAASLDVEVHPWLGIFNLIVKNFTLEDMAVALANIPEMRSSIDGVYIADKIRCVQNLLQLKERIRAESGEEPRMLELMSYYEAAIAGYLMLVGAMPAGRMRDQLLDEAIPLAQRFQAMDKLSRAAAVAEVMEGFSALARKWIGSSPLRAAGQKLKRMLLDSGVWSSCRNMPERVAQILEAVAGPTALKEVGLTASKKPAPAPEKGAVEVAVVGRSIRPEVEEACSSCGEPIPREFLERLSFCPACGAPIRREKRVIKRVYEDEIGELCPLCGGGLRKEGGRLLCDRCNVIYEVERKIAMEEDEAWMMVIPRDVLRDPGVKVVVLKGYPYNLSATFTVRCEGVDATVYSELVRRGVKPEELIEKMVRMIGDDARMGKASILLLTKVGTDPWNRSRIYLERAISLISTLTRIPWLKSKLKLAIIVPDETIFCERVAEELKSSLESLGIEAQEYEMEVPYDRILEAARKAGISKPEQLIRLLAAFPRALKHLKRGRALPDAIKLELGPDAEEYYYIVDAVKKFCELGRKLSEEEAKQVLGGGGAELKGRLWIKIQTLRALGIVAGG